MEATGSPERQARAARNQTLFRALNEKLHDVNDALSAITETFVIACECADVGCVKMIDIAPGEYDAVRADSRRFVVLPDHVYLDVEKVVDRRDGYVIVEKLELAGEIADRHAEASEERAPR